MVNNPSISVIIPIYGVEKYIARCARSLFEQSLAFVTEFIFVNDATADRSIEILSDVVSQYPSLADNVKILNHKVNKGLPAARNTGLSIATGDYIIHVDGDDFCENNMLEFLYEAAINNNADFVWCDYFIAFETKKRVIHQPDCPTPIDAVRAMLRGSMKYNVWNKLCRRTLYSENGIIFPDGHAMGEDLTMIMVALNARKCAYVGKPLYNYVQSEGQMTAVYNEKKLSELCYNCERLAGYMKENFSDAGLESENAALCQLMKWPFLLDGKFSSWRRWHEWFPESNRLIWQTKGVNMRIKFIEWCAAKHLYPIVWLHYILVIKMFYGIAYK
mgnify:CR=1 FL=1